MFYRRSLKKFDEKVRRPYDKKFAYIESVLESCVTLDQIDNGARWASSVIEQYYKHETKRIGGYSMFDYFTLKKMIEWYFRHEQEIVTQIFLKKVKEIEKREVKPCTEN